jgi:polyhydroxyalkanoate synthesis regulator phasin
MTSKSLLIAGALAIGLVLGIAVGPTVWAGRANAQSQPPGQQTKATNYRNVFLDKLAAALKIQRPQLDSAIKTAGDQTVDQAVKDGKLTQPRANDLKARIAQGQFGGFWGGQHGGKGNANLGQVRKTAVEAAAKALNLTPAELKTQLRNGKTLDQLAKEHNTTTQTVTNAALAAAKAQLDQAVKDGKLTQPQANMIYDRLQKAAPQLLHRLNGKQHGLKWRGRNKSQAPTQGITQ